MPLTPEEIKEIKAQLREQVAHLPDQQKQAALFQIDQMSPDAVETLVNQQRERSDASQKGIYRMIIEGDVPSTKVEENDWALAVLEINPTSKGHLLVIPKTAIKDEKDLPKPVRAFAEELAKRLIEKLKAKKTDVINQFQFGEVVVNVLPSYETSVTLTSPRAKATPEQLEELAKQLKAPPKKPEVIKIKTPKPKPSQILKLPRRIP